VPPSDARSDPVALTTHLLGLITNSWITQALYVVAKLKIADLLVDSPKTAEELAETTGTHAPSLRRLLRALITIDICSEGSDGAFSLTKMGALLRADAPDSLQSWTIYWGDHLWSVWAHLADSVKTGESSRKSITGCDGFAHLERDPELAAVFNRAMAELTRLISMGIVQSYDFSNTKRIVDVGGGYGELLVTILRTHPEAYGVLFDLPHAVDEGKRYLAKAGLDRRCDFISGDFFETVPPGGDVYVLNSVVHDWDEGRCRIILENCRREMTRDTKLLLVERIMPGHLQATGAHQTVVRSDLTMLIALGGRERTEAEFRSLLRATGFRIGRILPAQLSYSLIEALPD
jgi:orsellinic acid C2-O-methyltransferase